VTASVSNLTGIASIAVGTNLNLALAGTGYTWYGLSASTANSPRATAAGINDGDLNTDVPLLPGGGNDTANAYEAAGIIWSTPPTIGRITYHSGSYTTSHDGVFDASFGLQFSPDGTTWTNAAAWTVTPAYTYNSPAAANVSFTFTGGEAAVRGVRCVGRVHTSEVSTNSWYAFTTEVEAFAPSPLPPPVLSAMALSTNILVAWPAALTNYLLEATTDLLPTNTWLAVTNAPQQGGDLLTVTVPAATARRFFRLHQH
jgi:hypothetical protein